MRKTKGSKTAVVVSLLVALVVSGLVWQNWPHVEFLVQFESLGRNVQSYSEYRHRKTGIVFVRLPSGTFNMGSPETEEGRDYIEHFHIETLHEVSLSPFLIAKYEVTEAEWQRVMGIDSGRSLLGDNYPVTKITWGECRAFCSKTGLTLPTEAQWEYACRAGAAGPYAGTGKLDDMGWYDRNSGDETHPVGQKRPNDFGLFDMHGNVFEWCEDVHYENFYSKPEALQKDPVCTMGSEYRVVRGGCSITSARMCRSASRGRGSLTDSNIGLGFRPAAPLP